MTRWEYDNSAAACVYFYRQVNELQTQHNVYWRIDRRRQTISTFRALQKPREDVHPARLGRFHVSSFAYMLDAVERFPRDVCRAIVHYSAIFPTIVTVRQYLFDSVIVDFIPLFPVHICSSSGNGLKLKEVLENHFDVWSCRRVFFYAFRTVRA